ncbi:zinc finger BED domain-containing protein 4 [Synchiropus splendidus]|uniref:zinc finger BED domain-containing protein 4 n=1 Tax=Synchiropus splendidus TaxID=270530 RepID=UPI00237E35C2|nr:zinc finger BED domain-containing protein 4 [Synchiropus splendidus]
MASKVSILDYFHIVFEGENGKIESNCKACGTRIQAKRSVTSNFVTHLKRKHQAIYDDFVKRKDMKREGFSSTSLIALASNLGTGRLAHCSCSTVGGAVGAGAAGGLEGGRAPVRGDGKFEKLDPRQVRISEAITKMIIRDLQPVSLVEQQGFRDLLQLLEPRYTPEPQHCIQTRLLPAYAYQAQLAICQALSSALALSLSLDLWRGACGYLGVTCHFLSPDWKMHSSLLACLPLAPNSPVHQVLSEFDEVCLSHGILGRSFRVVADPLVSMATVQPCCLPIFPASGEDRTALPSDCSGDVVAAEDPACGLARVGCFSRALGRCVCDGLRSCPQLCAALTRAAQFYSYITSAVPQDKLSQLFDGPDQNLTEDQDWAAQLKVLGRLLDSLEFLEEMSGAGELTLGAQERALLRDLMETLEPFSEAWDLMFGEKEWDEDQDRHVSISLAVPCVLGLRKHLSEVATPHCPGLRACLSQAVECQLAPILEDPLYITATVLDPQFKLTWSSSPDWHRQVLAEELPKLSKSVNTDPHQPPHALQAPAPVCPLASRPSKLFSFIKQRPATQAKSLEQELTIYLQEEPTEEEPLHYWRRKEMDFPLLAQVARRTLTIPARSSPVARIFTRAHRSLHPDGAQVLPKNLETLIYLKANYRLLWTGSAGQTTESQGL